MNRNLLLLLSLIIFSVKLTAQQPSPEKITLSREHFNAGVKYGLDEDFEQSVKEFTSAAELNPLFAEAYLYKGLAEIELQEYDNAIKNFTITIELDPSFSDQAHYFRGLAKYFKKEYSTAIDDFTVAIRMNPDFISFYQRGLANLMLGEYRRSLQDFDIAIRLKEDFYEAYLNRAISLYHLQFYDEAMKDLDIARKNLDDKALVDQYLSLISQALKYGTHHAPQGQVTLHRQPSQTVPGQPTAGRSTSERPTSTDLNFAELFSASRNQQETEKSDNTSIQLNNEQNPALQGQLPVLPRREEPVPIAETNNRESHRAQAVSDHGQPASFDNLQSGIYSQHLHKVVLRGFGVQVASYSNTNNLISLAEAYSGKYELPVFINVSNVNGRKMFKLIIGRFENRAEAETFRNRLRIESFPDSFLVVYENL